jgi:hypothetical protein
MSLTQTQTTRAQLAEPRRLSPTGSRPAAAFRSVVARLQRNAGNVAIHRLLRREGIQPKLTVNRPGDAFEREADRVADDVMRMPDPGWTPTVQRAPQIVQRACRECEDERRREHGSHASMSAGDAHVNRMCAECEEEQDGNLHAKHGTSDPPDVSSGVESYVANRHGGQPLSDSARAYFEPRFGRDFSDVRVHTDTAAADSARALNARAYTFGSNVVFGGSEYAPETPAGRRLLAHELTHVVQQRQGGHDQAAMPSRVMPYRSAGSANFGACDTSTLTEKTLTSRKTDPWIKSIEVDFSGTGVDSNGETIPKGTLTATYAANAAKLSGITANVVGGAASDGLTDKGHHTVTRIEGCGYHHTTVPKADRITGHKRAGKYFKPSLAGANASMNFAVFFVEGPSTGNQALHEGSLGTGSLACVHVGSRNIIQQINYHSIAGVTTVDVSYDAAALTDLCCARFNAVGRMVSNPCGGQKSAACP